MEVWWFQYQMLKSQARDDVLDLGVLRFLLFHQHLLLLCTKDQHEYLLCEEAISDSYDRRVFLLNILPRSIATRT